jgi:serine/threonine protein kinase
VKDEEDPNKVDIIIKITDFGFAVTIDPEVGETLSLGSPTYTAPEVFKS